jgi:hypothetical protein
MSDSEKFKEYGYVYVENFIDAESIKIVSMYMENKIRRDEWKQNYTDSITSFSYYSDPLIEVLLQKSLNLVSTICEKELFPTYSFSRVYLPGEELKKHVDRPSCEISVTVNVASVGPISPIWMGYENKTPVSIYLNPGDAVIYKGCEVFHWREPIKENQMNVQFMLHYVDKYGKNNNYKWDNRCNLGYPAIRRS